MADLIMTREEIVEAARAAWSLTDALIAVAKRMKTDDFDPVTAKQEIKEALNKLADGLAPLG